MSLKDMARRAAVLDTLKAVVDAEAKAARAELQAGLKAAKAEAGTQQIAVDLDGADIGKVSLVQPAAAAVVVDEAALLAWVREVAPSEISSRVVTEIRPAYWDALLKQITAAGTAEWADPETGVIHEVPGVEVRGRAAYTRLTVPKEGKAAIAEAWRSGGLAAVLLPQLGAGEELA